MKRFLFHVFLQHVLYADHLAQKATAKFGKSEKRCQIKFLNKGSGLLHLVLWLVLRFL